MEKSNSNSNLKAIIIVLALLLAGSITYIFVLSSDVAATQVSLKTSKTEKEELQEKFEAINDSLTAKISENTEMSADLIAERDKVQAMIADLKKSKGDVASLSKFKQMYVGLETKMKDLFAQNEVLKKQNVTLTTQRDSTVVVLSESKMKNDELASKNEELAKTVEIGSKLNVMNVKAVAYKQKSSGKQVLTDKAGRADVLKISFTIAANPIAKSGEKEYYVQIIGTNNGILGDKKIATFEGGKTLEYTFVTTVKYDRKAVDVSQDVPGNKFDKGTYFVNIFDKTEMVSTSSVSLK